MNKKRFRNKRLFQGMGIGYITCLFTHILAALLPMYVVFPFTEQLFGRGHSSGCGDYHAPSNGLLSHILEDILILTMVLIPVALLTWLGHKIVRQFKIRCGGAHEENPCENCLHQK